MTSHNYASAKFPDPRPFQSSAREKLRAGFAAGHRCQMVMSPTGSGKTILAMFLIQECLMRNKRVIFVADRRTLINQTSEVADSLGLISHGVLMANHWRYNVHLPFQIASAQTLARRDWPDADLIIIDESHTQLKAWTDHIPTCRAAVIGLSATPFSPGLGKLFSNLVNATTMRELTESGVLVPMRVLSCTKVNMKGAATAGGEWTDKAAEERGMDIVGDVVHEWIKHAEGRKTIVFGSTIAHVEGMVREFNSAGIMAVAFTADTTDAERKEILEDFKKPDSILRVLVSVEALAKGFDQKDVSCVCDVRPLRKSLSTAIQMWGRGLRASPETGKKDLLLLDFCIATGSKVMTNRGLVAIEEILLYDLLWDGYNFVSHKGVISRGKKPVITYAGLTATSDHLVKTKEGWRTLGECSSKQIAIVTTGIGGEKIWACENYFTGPNLARAEASDAPSCFMRVRDVWLSVVHSIFQPHKWRFAGLQNMQQTAPNTAMASGAVRFDGSKVWESFGTCISRLWWARDKIQLRWSNRLRTVDTGKSWASEKCSGFGIRSDKQRWQLRAGEYSVGHKAEEHVQYKGEQAHCKHAQIHAGSPGGSVRRIYTSILAFCRNVIRRNSGEVQQAIEQAEREVWDILDCGPRNSFTCEGLLVHNCGNIVRFSEDYETIYHDGLDALDMGEKLDNTIRKDDEEKSDDPIKCPKCSYSPFRKRCISCGHEIIKQNLIEHEAGEMVEFRIGKSTVGDKLSVWTQCVTLCRNQGKPETAKGRASHLYKSITGVFPRGLPEFDVTPNVTISRSILNKQKANSIAFRSATK
jgi:superfamily II DNA or RNA helicase